MYYYKYTSAWPFRGNSWDVIVCYAHYIKQLNTYLNKIKYKRYCLFLRLMLADLRWHHIPVLVFCSDYSQLQYCKRLEMPSKLTEYEINTKLVILKLSSEKMQSSGVILEHYFLRFSSNCIIGIMYILTLISKPWLQTHNSAPVFYMGVLQQIKTNEKNVFAE